jgi:hypothetical protein
MPTETGGLSFMPRPLPGILLLLLVTACGGNPTLADYAEEIETLVIELNREVDALDAQREARGPSVEGEVEYWESRTTARRQFYDGLDALDPPGDLAEMHDLALDIMRRYTAAEEALAAKARELEDLAGIAALWASAEMTRWEAVDEESRVICLIAQQEFDETQQRAELGDLPWIPGDMKETVRVAFGCTAEARGS